MNLKISLIYIDSGGGHRAAATALCDVIREQQRPWDLEMLCIQDLLDPIDFIRKYTGIPFQDIYNIMLRRGWTLGSGQLIPVMHLLIRLFHDRQVRILESFWRGSKPDLVVSMIPHYNRALRIALDKACPGVPFITILTDIADYPPHFWIERQDQWLICGSEQAVAQARQIGMGEDRILHVSGMIMHPKFYAPLEIDRRAERVRLGLHPDKPTGIILFGGEGSMEIVNIVRALNREDAEFQLIAICGRNREAAAELRAIGAKMPLYIEGFTREIPFYMELADFLIGKPGPGCISEALAKRLPVIVQKNAWTMVHERYNVDWIRERGVGLVVRNYSAEIAGAVRDLLAPDNYQRFRDNAAQIRNRAVYEIPALMESILASSVTGSPSAPSPAIDRTECGATRIAG